MERTQFTFYESFYKAISRIKNKASRAEAYDAICQYAMYGKEPDLDSLPDAVAIAFELSKPNLDASRRKAVSGKRGGEAKQSGSKAEANDKQSASKKEKEKEKENEIEKEYECTPISPFSAVLASYTNRINPIPTEMCRAELETFVRELGSEVCLRAIDVAIDERKTNWSYIRGILKAKKEQGVRSLADWDRVDAQRKSGNKNAVVVPQEKKDQRAKADLENARRLLASMGVANG